MLNVFETYQLKLNFPLHMIHRVENRKFIHGSIIYIKYMEVTRYEKSRDIKGNRN